MSNQPSVMKHVFSELPKAEIPRSSFDRSHGCKSTFDSGYLVPMYVDEALPGDTFNMSMTGFARLATPIHPVMDNLWMDTQFFAVPVRLVWDNFKKFCGEQTNPGDSTDYVVPQMAPPVGGYLNETLSDYFGIPTQVDGFTHSALFHRAYNLIYNEWYRDQNLQDSLPVDKDDGPDLYSDYVLQRRGKRHDYFTSCLPWAQKGDSVSIPLGTEAPVLGIGVAGTGIFVNNSTIREADGNSRAYTTGRWASDANQVMLEGTAASDGYPTIHADLTNATAATINQLRQAFQIQKLLERDARGGTRYTEIVRSHFGVTSPDARLQRPEFLGGGSTRVGITPVPQTTSTDATTPQGNLSGFGTAGFTGHGFTKSFTEHTLIIGIVSVRADLTYQQGLNRMFSRNTRYDFYWPALAHIGEQAVLNKEIYTQGTAQDEEVFGYQERYAEYRYKPSTITGKFRSNDAQSLDPWHLSQDFGSLPTLGNTFITEQPPVDRVVALPDEPEFLFDGYFNLRCARPMPLYGVPGMIDRF